MVLAVLESRCGIGFGPSDVYLNVAGGLRISEPAADLAVAAALVSAREDIPLPRDAVFFGEISLSGALRPAPQAEARLREAAKLGFAAAWAPPDARRGAANALDDSPGCGSRGIHGQVLRHDRALGEGTCTASHIVDGIVLAVIVVSAVLAYARGLVRECAVDRRLDRRGARRLLLRADGRAADARDPGAARHHRHRAASSAILAGFAVVFVVALILVSLFTPLLAGAVVRTRRSARSTRALGFLFGIVRGVLLVVIALVVYNTRLRRRRRRARMIDNSHSVSDLRRARGSGSPRCCRSTRRSGSPASTTG